MAVVYASPPVVAPAVPHSRAVPLSARERKQVYMHSTVFEPPGSPAVMYSIYHPARQQAIVENVKQCRAVRPQQDLPSMPSPADYKATVNSGHWVVTPAPAGTNSRISLSASQASEGYAAAHGAVARKVAGAVKTTAGAGAGGGIYQFHKDADPIGVVRARSAEHGLPKEYWATNSKLQWTDPRSELATLRRGQELQTVRQEMDAGKLKRLDLSSATFGGVRCYEKSTEAPQQEIRSMEMKDMHCVDSALDRQMPPEHKHQSTMRKSMSARGRSFQNLSTSNGNQFPRQTSNPELTSPRRTDITKRRSEKAEVEARRRCERNYSDIFFTSATSARPSPRGVRREISRGEPTGNSNCSFLDPHVELRTMQNQRLGQRARPGQDTSTISETSPKIIKASESTENIWPWQPESPRAPPESVNDKSHRHEERSCWDTNGIMEANAELSRRQRQLHHPQGRPQPRNKTAAEMKRVELASGQMRKGFGCSAAEWDDGRGASSPNSPRPSMYSRSCTDSPMSLAVRGTQLNSPRMRKLESLMSQFVY